MTDQDGGVSGTNTPSSRAARSREKMLRAATDLLVESGPRSVTVDAVAESSGVAKSTLYRHWPSRDAMLVDVVRCNIPESSELELAQGFEHGLRHYLHNAAVALADPEWSRIIPAMVSLRVSMPEVAACVEVDQSSKADLLGRLLEVGASEGSIPSDIDAHQATTLLLGPLVFAAIMGDHSGLVPLAEQVADRFLASYRI